jgi:energy-coupling factor transporter ATP-binding protein EcfA2
MQVSAGVTKHSVTVRCDVPSGFEVESVRGLFDLPTEKTTSETFTVDLPDPDGVWSCGVIVGPSGSGKSTIAREAYGSDFVDGFRWKKDKAVIQQFGAGIEMKAVTQMLTAVGFSSPPSWVKPYHVLSGGERFRCDLARALLRPGKLVAFDEFTSVVDRTVAKIGSAAIAKALAKGRIAKQFVAVTCHYDVIEWLTPDWVLDMASGKLARGCLQQRPGITLHIHRATPRCWNIFRRTHYLSGDIHRGSKVFVGFIENQPVGLIAVIHYPHPTGGYWKEHRSVVLPDFQGIGIGNSMSDLVASAFKATGKQYRDTTAHPSHVHYRDKSPDWIITRKAGRNSRAKANSRVGVGKTSATGRLTFAFRYVGPANEEVAKGWGLI